MILRDSGSRQGMDEELEKNEDTALGLEMVTVIY
jgi:hypothetical protein